MVVTHAPDFMSEVVQNFDNYNQQDKDAIDGAIENRIRTAVEQHTGIRMNGDQIGGALSMFAGLVRYGQEIGYNGDPRELVSTLLAERNGVYFGMPAPPAPGFVPQAPPYQVAEAIGRELGTAPEDPIVASAYNMQVRALMAHQGQIEASMRQQQQQQRIDGIAQEAIDRVPLPQGFEDERELLAGAVKSRLQVPAMEQLRRNITGWEQEGKPEQARKAAERYRNVVNRVVDEVAAIQRKSIQGRQQKYNAPRPQQPAQPTAPRRYRNEDEQVDAVTKAAVAYLRANKR